MKVSANKRCSQMNLSHSLDGTQDDLAYGKLVDDGSFARELLKSYLKIV